MSDSNSKSPFSFKASWWHGAIFAGTFLLYGGVMIVLSLLDRTYSELNQMIMFALLGIILLIVVYAYKDHKKWGWYGMIGLNAVIVIYALIGYDRYENIIIMILSAASLYLLSMKSTKDYLSKQS